MVIFLSSSLASFSPYYSGWLTTLLWSSLTETCNKNFGDVLESVAVNKEKKNHFQLDIAQPEDDVQSNDKRLL